MKRRFIDKRFKPESLERIEVANGIIDRYLGLGLRLTLRQLYYQFVAHHGLPNTERSYKGLASLMSEARLAGLVDWDAIEDRGREPVTPSEWDGSLRLSSRRCARSGCLGGWVEKQGCAPTARL